MVREYFREEVDGSPIFTEIDLFHVDGSSNQVYNNVVLIGQSGSKLRDQMPDTFVIIQNLLIRHWRTRDLNAFRELIIKEAMEKNEQMG